MPEESDDVRELAEIILEAAAREAGKDREWIGLELEQVVTRTLFEAAKRTRRRIHDAPTVKRKTLRGFPPPKKIETE